MLRSDSAVFGMSVLIGAVEVVREGCVCVCVCVSGSETACGREVS